MLKARKAFALKQFPVHTQPSALRIFTDVILEVKCPASDERRDCGVRDREVVPDSELPVCWCEELLEIRDGLNEGVWRLSADKEGDLGREDLGRESVDEKAYARTIDGVLWEKARVWV